MTTFHWALLITLWACIAGFVLFVALMVRSAHKQNAKDRAEFEERREKMREDFERHARTKRL